MKKYFVFCLLLTEFLVFGCSQPANQKGRALLLTARRQYEQKNYPMCSNTLTQFLREYGRSQEAGEAFYLRGLSYREMGSGKEAEARADFEKAIQKSRDPEIQALAHVALGHMYFEKVPQELAATIEHYKSALKGLKNEPPKDVVLYRLAVTLQRQGDWAEADLFLSRCFDTFKNSSFAPYARQQFGARMYRLQVAAFSNMRFAQNKIKELQGDGWIADWTAYQKDGTLFYQVRVGQYADYAQAQKAYQELRKIEPKTEIVTASNTQKN
jgi:tetratricopeptide (TPR) repeat protein